jgi:hypothetical protein
MAAFQQRVLMFRDHKALTIWNQDRAQAQAQAPAPAPAAEAEVVAVLVVLRQEWLAKVMSRSLTTACSWLLSLAASPFCKRLDRQSLRVNMVNRECIIWALGQCEQYQSRRLGQRRWIAGHQAD